jgi:hypothetical protein
MFIGLVLLTACYTAEKCNRLFPPSISSEYIKETKDSIVYRDTTIHIPADTASIRIQMKLLCDSLLAHKSVQLHANSGRASITLTATDGVLTATAVCHALQMKVTLREVIRKTMERFSRHEQRTIEVNKLTRWQRFFITSGYVAWGVLLGIILHLTRKWWLKLLSFKLPFS